MEYNTITETITIAKHLTFVLLFSISTKPTCFYVDLITWMFVLFNISLHICTSTT